jgi:hypothetical protein
MSIAAERYAGCGHMGAEGRKNVLQGGVKKLSTKFTKICKKSALSEYSRVA